MSANILEKIALSKKNEVAILKSELREEELKARVKDLAPPRDFVQGITKHHSTAVIAEIKKASPSKGLIRPDFKPRELAAAYEQAGAAALSVLTDKDYFQGEPAYITEVKGVSRLPVLRKDFIIDPYQIYQSRELGADAILLIAALLTESELLDFEGLALELGLAVLVEIHSPAEVDKIKKLKTPLIGVNNRDLTTFTVNLEQVLAIKPLLPAHKTLVCESGIHTRGDVVKMEDAGIHVFLIGESLMREPDVGAALLKLLG